MSPDCCALTRYSFCVDLQVFIASVLCGNHRATYNTVDLRLEIKHGPLLNAVWISVQWNII